MKLNYIDLQVSDVDTAREFGRREVGHSQHTVHGRPDPWVILARNSLFGRGRAFGGEPLGVLSPHDFIGFGHLACEFREESSIQLLNP